MQSRCAMTPKVQMCTKGLTELVELGFWPLFYRVSSLLSGNAPNFPAMEPIEASGPRPPRRMITDSGRC